MIGVRRNHPSDLASPSTSLAIFVSSYAFHDLLERGDPWSPPMTLVPTMAGYLRRRMTGYRGHKKQHRFDTSEELPHRFHFGFSIFSVQHSRPIWQAKDVPNRSQSLDSCRGTNSHRRRPSRIGTIKWHERLPNNRALPTAVARQSYIYRHSTIRTYSGENA
jgi:hypothetical protein